MSMGSSGMETPDMAAMAPQLRVLAASLVAVPIAAFFAGMAWLGAPDWRLLAFGAVGWLLALALRQPVALVAGRLTSAERTAGIVGWASGPAEEGVRVGLVLLAVGSAPGAVWAGIGWAGIEVVMIAVNSFVVANLLTRDDPKALKVQAILRERGMPATSTAGWAVAERCSAMALHVGFTLLLLAQPWWALATMLAHSLINMIAVHYAKRSVAGTELVLAVISLAVFLCGLAATGGF
jgi:hypothetical protein